MNSKACRAVAPGSAFGLEVVVDCCGTILASALLLWRGLKVEGLEAADLAQGVNKANTHMPCAQTNAAEDDSPCDCSSFAVDGREAQQER